MKTYILRDAHNNTLEIERVQVLKTENIYLWVLLTHNGQRRLACYKNERGSTSWLYHGGEDEPDMPDSLLELFHGEEGDSALEMLYLFTTI